jgi:ATP-dependent RNA helicase SUPV3L1/SUV3
MAQLDRLDGDIDTLMMRIAHTRTWTYITHRGDWLDSAAEWQERARGIEDRLSDALHELITQRFVDRRSAFLVRQLAGDGELLASVDKQGAVCVEGTHVGRLDGFRFVPDASEGAAMRTLLTAANRVLRTEVTARARQLANDSEEAFGLDAAGRLHWRGGPVGRLVAGETMLAPRVEVQASDFLDGEVRERVRQRLQLFVKSEIERRLAPLFAVQALPLLGIARGLVFQLVDALGCLATADVGEALRALDRQTRRSLGRVGVRFGTESIYVEPLLGAETTRFRALLWAIRHGHAVPSLPGTRRHGRAIMVDPGLPASFYAAIGRRVLGGWALRPDCLERFVTALRERARAGRFAADMELASITGVASGELRRLVTALGYRAIIEHEQEFFIGKPRRRNPPESLRRRVAPHEGHPFAKLRELNIA